MSRKTSGNGLEERGVDEERRSVVAPLLDEEEVVFVVN